MFYPFQPRTRTLLLAATAVGVALLSVSRSPAQTSVGASPASQARRVLQQRCFQCHGQNGVATKNVFVLDRARLVQGKVVVPGDAHSRLIAVVESGAMPLGAGKLAPAEVDVLRDWVTRGAPDWDSGQPSAARKLLTETALEQAIGRDLAQAPERDRRFLRYYSIAHLYNAGVPEAELDGYRIGLSRLINSLSWRRTIVSPQPIDAARTMLRIDLRDYGWSLATWKTVARQYPYGYRTPAGEHIYELSGVEIPYIRADWFVANASVPPLYHSILGLPNTVGELEKLLKVDAAADLDGEKNVLRAGTRNSGVSRNNRVVERHLTGYGAYWKSFDFRSNTGDQNIFKDPLDFHAAGGEMVFNLPNGLQGYYLANGTGQRLDRAPVEIVSDRSFPDDPVVVNGRSCMSCHYAGTKSITDEIRAVVEKEASPTFDKARALALYAPQHELDGVLREDAERFRAAVAETGGTVSVDFRTEPINALARKYSADLSLPQAAAELGMSEADFRAQLASHPRLDQLGLGALVQPEGGIKRDAWEEYFGQVVSEFGDGFFLAHGHAGGLLVGNARGNNVIRYDEETGEQLDTFVRPGAGGLESPMGLAFGPDGNLYVADEIAHAIRRYHGDTGAYMDDFIPANRGGLGVPRGLVFGPDGCLYVSSMSTDSILRYSGKTGAFLNAFVPSGHGGLKQPHNLAFGPDGNLYVCSYGSACVLRFAAHTGTPMGVFTTGYALTLPADMVFGPDGYLYVSCHGAVNGVVRFNGKTGAFLDLFLRNRRNQFWVPHGLAFTPNGDLVAVGQASKSVLRLSPKDGGVLQRLPGDGLDQPAFMLLSPHTPHGAVAANQPAH